MAGFYESWPCMTGRIHLYHHLKSRRDFKSLSLSVPYHIYFIWLYRISFDVCSDMTRSFEDPPFSIPRRPRQIIRQPTEWCSGQTAPPPHPLQPPLHCTILTNLTAASCHLRGAMCKWHIHASLSLIVFPQKLQKSSVNIIDIIFPSHWIQSNVR